MGSTTWKDGDGFIHALSGASQAEVNKNLPGSEVAHRWMCAANLGLWLSTAQELKSDVIRAALADSLERIRVDSMLNGATAFKLQLGGATESGGSTASRVRLLRCLAYNDKKKFAMAIGKLAWTKDLNIMDFGEAVSVKDCERITVIMAAVMSFVEFFCWAFGEEHRRGICKDLLDLVRNASLEEATRARPLYIPFILSQVLAALFNMMRSTILIEVGGVKQHVVLGNGGYVAGWEAILKKFLEIKPDTLKNFKEEGLEEEFTEQLEERFGKGSKNQPSAEDSGSDSDSSDEPAAKRARGEGLCFGALAKLVRFRGVRKCKRPACKYTHVFTGLSQSEVTRAIEASDLSFLQGGSVKADFVAAAVRSGKF